MGGDITPAEIRAYANLPQEVPEALLDRHIAIAARDLARDTGLNSAPSDPDEQWAEALTVRALASVFPWLNTFALDGAAKVGRLEGSVEYRFLDPEEVEERIDHLMSRYRDLIARLNSPDEADAPSDRLDPGSVFMAAI